MFVSRTTGTHSCSFSRRSATSGTATPVGSKAGVSVTELDEKLARTLDDGEIARILNMRTLPTPRGLRWTNDRVKAFRAHHHIHQRTQASDSNILTGLQARQHLGVGYTGLMALVRRGVVHTHQVTDFAPYRISRAELDSEPVQSLVRALEATARLPPPRGVPTTSADALLNEINKTIKGCIVMQGGGGAGNRTRS